MDFRFALEFDGNFIVMEIYDRQTDRQKGRQTERQTDRTYTIETTKLALHYTKAELVACLHLVLEM